MRLIRLFMFGLGVLHCGLVIALLMLSRGFFVGPNINRPLNVVLPLLWPSAAARTFLGPMQRSPRGSEYEGPARVPHLAVACRAQLWG
jgi:hypothetical protein